MKVIVNKEEREYPEGTTLEDLVTEFKGSKHVSHIGAWRNGRMTRPAAYKTTIIEENDTVEIKRFGGGG